MECKLARPLGDKSLTKGKGKYVLHLPAFVSGLFLATEMFFLVATGGGSAKRLHFRPAETSATVDSCRKKNILIL